MVQFTMDIKTTRMLNLRKIIKDDYGGNAGKCAEELAIKRPQIHRWVTENEAARQGISEGSARSIEEKMGKPPMWLDGMDVKQDQDAVVADFAWVYAHADDKGRILLQTIVDAVRSGHCKAEDKKQA